MTPTPEQPAIPLPDVTDLRRDPAKDYVVATRVAAAHEFEQDYYPGYLSWIRRAVAAEAALAAAEQKERLAWTMAFVQALGADSGLTAPLAPSAVAGILADAEQRTREACAEAAFDFVDNDKDGSETTPSALRDAIWASHAVRPSARKTPHR